MSLDSSSRTRASTRIAGDRVRVLDAPVLVTHNAPEGADNAHGCITVAPRVEGQRITAIEIHCGCGQCLTIECVYDEAEPAASPEEQAAVREESHP